MGAAALAGALAVFIEPGPYNWLNGVTGITVLLIVVAYEIHRRRTRMQSLALAAVCAFVGLLVVGLGRELYIGGWELKGVCLEPTGCKLHEYDSTVSDEFLAVAWSILVGIMFVSDRIWKLIQGRET